MLISRSILSVIEILLTLCNATPSSRGESICATFGCISYSYCTEKEARCQEGNRLFSKSGQHQNALDLDAHPSMRMGEHCRTKRVVFSRLEGKTARFIGQILPHAHAGMDILALLSSLPFPVLGR